jgi:hypothetical protein
MPCAVKKDELKKTLAEFQFNLVGCWKNETFGQDKEGNDVGGEDNPLSYNITSNPSDNLFILELACLGPSQPGFSMVG